MKTRLCLHRRQKAFTYLTVIVTMIVVGLMLAAYLKLVAVQNQLTVRSQSWNRSVPILEAGIEEAMAHLNKNGSPDSGGNLNLANMGGDGWTADAFNGPWRKWSYLEGDYYFVQIDRWAGTTTNFPFINSTGYVRQLPAFALYKPFSPFVATIFDDLVSQGKYSKRIVQCTTTNTPTFTRALVARKGIDLNGNDVVADSFDSANPAYNTDGRWDPDKRRDHGDIASNDTITNAINVGNANIWGSVATGPFGTVSVGSQGSVGDAAWQAGGHQGQIQPGHSTDDMNVEFPDVAVPIVAWSAMPSGGDRGTNRYTYIFDTDGNYRLPVGGGEIVGNILVTANKVRLLVQTGWRFTGQDQLTIGTNAHITIYLDCPSADLTGNGIINNNGTADQCYIFGTSKLTTLDMGGNGETTCVIYAPYANATFHGGGNNDEDFSGAAVLNSVKLTGHYSFHYDEALGRNGLWRGFTITSWNEK